MAGSDEDSNVDELLRRLSDDENVELDAEARAAFQQVAEEVENQSLQDRILSKYQNYGRELFSDATPGRLDAPVAERLKPLIGDVSNVRVHSGKLATEAARAMEARAFAIGDEDIFVDYSFLDQSSPQGQALLAHEVAHTKDAATGFALSSRKHGNATSAREEFADSVADDFSAGSGGAGPDLKQLVRKHKAELVRYIAEEVAKQQKRGGDRRGS